MTNGLKILAKSLDNRPPISKIRYGCTHEHERLYNIDINSSKGTAHLLLFCISVKVLDSKLSVGLQCLITIYQLDCNVWLQFISWITMFDYNLSVGLLCLITSYQLDCYVWFKSISWIAMFDYNLSVGLQCLITIYQLDCYVWLQFISWIAMFDSNLSVGLLCLITIYQLDCNAALTCNLFNMYSWYFLVKIF